ncbi:MAG: hypothetical protein ABW060_02175 [Solirubrobacteraceae bacterium]
MPSSTLKRSAATLGVIAGLLASAGSASAVVTDNTDPERKPASTVTCLDQDLNTLKQPVPSVSLGRENSIECLRR